MSTINEYDSEMKRVRAEFKSGALDRSYPDRYTVTKATETARVTETRSGTPAVRVCLKNDVEDLSSKARENLAHIIQKNDLVLIDTDDSDLLVADAQGVDDTDQELDLL